MVQQKGCGTHVTTKPSMTNVTTHYDPLFRNIALHD